MRLQLVPATNTRIHYSRYLEKADMRVTSLLLCENRLNFLACVGVHIVHFSIFMKTFITTACSPAQVE